MRWPARNLALCLGTLLFLAGQVLAVAHAAEFGTEPHSHANVACMVAVTDELDTTVPSADHSLPQRRIEGGVWPDNSTAPATRHCWALRPPATGPPTL